MTTPAFGFSVIIPTHDRLPFLRRCLASLHQLTYQPFEIIVVDDHSLDGSREFLDGLTDQRMTIIHNPTNLGVAAARNVGAARAKWPLLAFTDDDCTVDPNWLGALAEAFRDPLASFAFGRTSYIRENYRGYFPERLVTNGNGRWPGGGNIAFRRDVFISAGGFDPAFVAYNNEDTELAVRLVSNDRRFTRVPNAIVYHQAMRWTVRSLLRSIPNASVWPVLKHRYPQHYLTFGPDITGGSIFAPREYLYLFFLLVGIPLLLLRYLWHGERSLLLFFTKWPVWFIGRRLAIYRQAWRVRTFMC